MGLFTFGIYIFSTVFFISWILNWIIIHYQHKHLHLSGDHVASGPQKFHLSLTPRVGGCSIFLAYALGSMMLFFYTSIVDTLLLLVVALPVFLFGLIEDLSKRVSVMSRLLASFISALLGVWLLKAQLVEVDVIGIDYLLINFYVLSLLFTMLGIAGVVHAINIIDGFNGLAGAVVVFMLIALAYVSYSVNDISLFYLCVLLIAATLGFLAWNYPSGHIFAGDGGAYFWGVMLAEISVLLITRHNEVSPWFPLLLLIYPIWETLFSIIRRMILKNTPPGKADNLHLHQLIYRRVVRRAVGSEKIHSTQHNALTSPYLWILSLLTVIPAMLFWDSTFMLISFTVLFIVSYTWLYFKIIRFKTPLFLNSIPIGKNIHVNRKLKEVGIQKSP